MSKKLSKVEKAFGRSPDYHDMTPQEQWNEDKRLGILDWDGSEQNTKELLVKLAPRTWCSCNDWQNSWRYLKNHDGMNFCAFCGKKLKKGGGK